MHFGTKRALLIQAISIVSKDILNINAIYSKDGKPIFKAQTKEVYKVLKEIMEDLERS